MPSKRTLTDIEIQSIINLYQSGETVRSITKIIRTRTDTVTAVLDEHGIEIRSGRAKLTTVQENELVDSFRNGVITTELARRYEIHPSTVSSILTRLGVELRVGHPRGRGWSDQDRSAIIEMYRAGLSQQQIAGNFEISQTVVSRVLQDENEPITSRPFKTPEGHNRYKGGRVLHSSGYIQVIPKPEDKNFYTPRASPYVLEHRLVMSRKLGRPLTDTETVHHIDGDRTNNAPENLQLRQGKHGSGVSYICQDCGSHNVVTVEI